MMGFARAQPILQATPQAPATPPSDSWRQWSAANARPGRAARGIGRDVLGELAGRSAVARKVHDSYVAFRERAGAWSRISLKAVLEAREG